jgi:hypothetical protein
LWYVCLRHEAEFCESVNEQWGRGDGDSSPANELVTSKKKKKGFSFIKLFDLILKVFIRFSSFAVE